MQNSIKIGPSFFAKEKNDYADWRWAWVRELAQNGMDAPGSNKIEFNICLAPDGQNTVATCTNNGKPMDQDTLINKFLSIGESGKGFQAGAVGGFGKAKVLIAFTHQSYSIRTGELSVQGEGAQYSLASGLGYVHGTTTQVVMAGDETEKLIRAVKRFAAFSQWDGEITLNGEKLACNLRKGSPRREFAWGTVYTNKAFSNVVIVRVGGIPMFSTWTEFDRTVIIELKGASVETLTSNRDSLVWAHRNEFDRFLNDLVTNKSKALKASQPSYTHYSGVKFKASKENPERKKVQASARELVGGTPVLAAFAGAMSGPAAGVVSHGRVGVLEGTEGTTLPGTGNLLEQAEETGSISVVSQIQEFFVVKNETTLRVPDYYLPDSDQFGSYGKKLARMWGRMVLELHRMFGLESEFGIGFVFSDEAIAQHEESSEYGVVYYLNPAEIVEQGMTRSKSFKKRFKLTDRNRLLAIATHEFVHGLGYGSHSEDFACKLTEVTGDVLTHARKGGFSWCYR